MAFAGDVADDLEAVGQAHLGDLTQSRVRLLRRRRIDAGADATLLRAGLQRRHGVPRLHGAPRLADELADCRHRSLVPIPGYALSFRSVEFVRTPSSTRNSAKRIRAFGEMPAAREFQRTAAVTAVMNQTCDFQSMVIAAASRVSASTWREGRWNRLSAGKFAGFTWSSGRQPQRLMRGTASTRSRPQSIEIASRAAATTLTSWKSVARASLRAGEPPPCREKPAAPHGMKKGRPAAAFS